MGEATSTKVWRWLRVWRCLTGTWILQGLFVNQINIILVIIMTAPFESPGQIEYWAGFLHKDPETGNRHPHHRLYFQD